MSWGAIRNYHLSLGWTDIGYHAGVELVSIMVEESDAYRIFGHSGAYEILMGRMWDRPGAHTIGRNYDALGICFIGNYDLIAPPEPMLIAGAKLIALWMKLFNILPQMVYPHSAFVDKSCPGKMFPLGTLMDKVESFL